MVPTFTHYLGQHFQEFLLEETGNKNQALCAHASVQQNVVRTVQTASTLSNIIKSKGNVKSVLNESLNQFKLVSTSFQQFCSNGFQQMLKPFKRAFK